MRPGWPCKATIKCANVTSMEDTHMPNSTLPRHRQPARRAYQREWVRQQRLTNPAFRARAAARARDYYRRKSLGASRPDYDAILAAQGGICAICGNPPGTRRLAAQRATTGRLMGVLCYPCRRNIALWARDAEKLNRAEAYIRALRVEQGHADRPGV